MKKRSKYIVMILLAAGLFGLLVVVARVPREVDWSKSFSRRDITPLGNKLVFDVLPALFPEREIITARSPLSVFLQLHDVPAGTNFIYVNDAFSPDSIETRKLIETVEAGNSVFVAAEWFSHSFAGAMGIKTDETYRFDPSIGTEPVRFRFANRKLDSATGYWFRKAVSNSWFTRYDSVRTTVLGYDGNGKTNYIRMKLGNGALYIHCNPMIFTNYHLLTGNGSEYIFKCLSYLPVAPTVWDEYYKVGNTAGGSRTSYIFNSLALRIAWYIALLGIVLYFVFEGKRRQRAIPVIPPPQNSSLEFLETVSRLYLNRHDHRGIAHKRFVYFVDFIRGRYYIDVNARQKRAADEVSQKSGIAVQHVTQLLKFGWHLETAGRISQDDLHQFNRQLEYFYKNCR